MALDSVIRAVLQLFPKSISLVALLIAPINGFQAIGLSDVGHGINCWRDIVVTEQSSIASRQCCQNKTYP